MRARCRRAGAALFLLAAWLWAALALASEPNQNWRTLETAHIRVNYPEKLDSLAHYVAGLAENVYGTLSPLLEWEPRFKLELALYDHTDSPNGFVNVYPYNWMRLYSVPPDRLSVLNDYDDWAHVLVAHESTHVFQLDTKSGLPALYNLIFGGRWHPNQYMPRWYTEGMAVYNESHLTASGRERSSLFEMMLRMDVLEHRFLTLDQISGSLDLWPGGDVPYLYGGKFMQFLADKYGNRTFAALGYLYGQRVIPYALNTVLKQVTDDDYVRLYDEWRASLEARYTEDAKRLSALGLTPLTYLTDSGTQHDSPRFFPDGKRVLYFHDEQKPHRTGWFAWDIETGTRTRLIESEDNGGADLSPDGRRLVESARVTDNRGNVYFDLYLHDLTDREPPRRLTKGLRAREPAYSPDGHSIAYVQYTPGAAHLMLLNADTGATEAPLAPARFDQVFSPAFSPDGSKLAFVGWQFRGTKDVYLLDLATRELTRLTNDSALDLSPVFSPDGRFVIWSSDRTGIFNVYALELASGTVRRLTNVLGGAFASSLSPDGHTLFVTSYRAHGFDMASAPVDLDHAPLVGESLTPRPAPPPAVAPYAGASRPYSPFPSLYPKAWFVSLGEDSKGSTLGVSVSGDDISGHHSFHADVGMGLESADPQLAFSYTNTSFTPVLSLSAAHSSYTLSGAAVDNGKRIDQREAATTGSFGISLPFSGATLTNDELWPYSHRLSFSLGFRHTRLLNGTHYEPLTEPPQFSETGFTSSVGVSYAYSTRRSYPGYPSTAAGRSFSVSVRAQTKVLGSRTESLAASASYSEYIAMPYSDTQVLALRVVGGLSETSNRLRRTYYIGGPSNRDVVSDLIRESRDYGEYLRGYKPYSMGGDRYVLFKSEYRALFWRIDRGIGTWPIFLSTMQIAPFYDAGYAWLNDFDYHNIRQGVGAELRLDTLLGYQQATQFVFGYHHGLNKGGIHTLYIGLDNAF